MESIRILLNAIVRIVIGLALLVLVLGLVSLLFPGFKPLNLLSSNFWAQDWLPAPHNMTSFTSRNGGVYGTVYQPGTPFNGYNNMAPVRGQQGIEYVMYTDSGTKIIRADGSVVSESNSQYGSTATNISLYVRNLSVFQGGGITFGQNIYGEARDTMFTNGTFPIYIADQNGRTIATITAVAMNMWAVPGWTRFHATVSTRLPINTYCILNFRSTTQPLQVTLPVKCMQ